jgi:hypothetical protein
MRGRVVAFAAVCLLVAAGLVWLALGRRSSQPDGEPEERQPAIVARQVDRAPEIGAEKRAPTAPTGEPAEEIALDDAPVIAVLDILEALNERPEEEE